MAAGGARLRGEGRTAASFLRRVQALGHLRGGRTNAARGARRFHVPGQRRCIVRLSCLGATGAANTRAHLRYLGRDGVEPDGSPGTLYGPDGQWVAPDTFIERAKGDPGQVRIMLSPDDASELGRLRDVTCEVMAGLARDLDRELDWVAVDHANTGRLHAHVVVRGCDADGRALQWDRRGLHRRVRALAMAALTRELGPDADRTLRERLRAEARSQQLTGLDLSLVERSRAGVVELRDRPAGRDARLCRARMIDRVRTLSRMGLAAETAPLRWELAPDTLPTLRAMGERRETYRLLERAIADTGLRRPLRDRAVADGRMLERGITGALVAWGRRAGAASLPYAVVDETDGRVWYADVVDPPAGISAGMIVELRAANPDLVALDRAIEAGAGSRNGFWFSGRAGHEDADRRVRALARVGLAEPAGRDRWRVADGLQSRIRAAGLAREYRGTAVQVLDPLFLDRQVSHPGSTWLDTVARSGPATADRGFGREVREALAERQRRDLGVSAWRGNPDGTDRNTGQDDDDPARRGRPDRVGRGSRQRPEIHRPTHGLDRGA
ncbi:MAG: DUF3363 domain-containing protein [Rhodospirillales bacterium]|nr:DUF3363 domain-containing protein [Rhodospirillales bacterium]